MIEVDEMKRILSTLLAFVLCISLAPSAQAGVGTPSGNTLSKEEIKELIDSTTFSVDSQDIWVTKPSTTKYIAGELTTEAQEKALRRLNAWRCICGLSPVSLKEEYSTYCQYASVMQAIIGDLNHRPEQPDGMPVEFYQYAYTGSSNGNLAGNVPFGDMVDMLLSDHFGRNIPTVGHRRWFLNPAMQYTGFGYTEDANSKYKRYGVAYSTDKTGKIPAYEFIGFPAPGYFPSNTKAFIAATPWTIQLNPAIFGLVYPKDVTVSLTRLSDGKTWEFSSDKEYKAENTGEWFTVNPNLTGGCSTIIFRPDVTEYEGVWEVTATVASYRQNGEPTVINYTVEFFNTDTYEPEEECEVPVDMTLLSFTDVEEGNWAWPYIIEAYSDGAFLGYPDGSFGPAAHITAYQFASVLLRGIFGDTDNRAEVSWSASIDEKAEQHGLWNGMEGLKKSTPITRSQMAQIIYNALCSAGVDMSHIERDKFQDIEDSGCKEAIEVCASYGIIAGVSATEFDGNSLVTRAQAAVVYCRLKSVLP